MNKQYKTLNDGEYDCSATLHIKDGKAIVVLHKMFNLTPGTEIPLYRDKCSLLVEQSGGLEDINILNGHSII